MTKLRTPIRPDDHVSGQRDAPIQLVEYGDFECPHCGKAYWGVERLRRALGDQLCFVFRHFPLRRIHPHSLQAAEAAEASAAQDQFWEMYSALFANQRMLELPDLMSYAEELGLDLARFSEELASGRYEPRVRRDLVDGARTGVNGTPTFFLNGERHDGPHDYESLLRAIEGRPPAPLQGESTDWSR